MGAASKPGRRRTGGLPDQVAERPGITAEPASSDRSRSRAQLAAILLLTLAAAALRLWGVGWGMPSSDSMFSFHPDEGVNLANGVLDHGAVRPHLDIGFYNYGSFYFLLWQVAAAANSVYGLVALGPASSPNAPVAESIASLTMLGRLISVAAGAATVAVLASAVRDVWGFRAGMAAGAVQTVAPLATIHSRFATVDATATLLTTLTLWASLRLLRSGTIPAAALGGLAAGLAGATRYNAVLVAMAPLCAAFLCRAERLRLKRSGAEGNIAVGRRLNLAGVIVAACFFGFLAGCPGAVLNWDKFTADVLFEARKSAAGMGLLFEGTGNGHIYHWDNSLRFALGWPLLLVSSLAALGSLRRREPADIVLMAFAGPYFVAMGMAKVRFMRYMLPMVPVLSAWVGRSIISWPVGPGYGGVPNEPLRTGSSRNIRRLAWTSAVAASALTALAVSIAFSAAMSGTDARDAALKHIRRTLPRGSAIAFATTPWYWSPPLLPEFTAPVPGQVRRAMLLNADSAYVLRLPGPDLEWDISVLEDPPPDTVVVSDIESQDALRLRRSQALAFMRRLDAEYGVSVFGARPAFFGVPVVTARYLPVDLLYVCPEIRVYARRDEGPDPAAGGVGKPASSRAAPDNRGDAP